MTWVAVADGAAVGCEPTTAVVGLGRQGRRAVERWMVGGRGVGAPVARGRCRSPRRSAG